MICEGIPPARRFPDHWECRCLPNYEIGQRAADIPTDTAVHGKHMRPMTIKVDGPLVVRDTTAAWRAADGGAGESEIKVPWCGY